MKRLLLLATLALALLAPASAGQDEARDAAAPQKNRLLRLGKVEPGMTEQQVLSSQRKPDRVSRIATAGQLTEQWIYSSVPPLYVTLVRPDHGGGSVVVAVYAGR